MSKISGGLTDGLTEEQRAHLKEMSASGVDEIKIHEKRLEYLKVNGITDHR